MRNVPKPSARAAPWHPITLGEEERGTEHMVAPGAALWLSMSPRGPSRAWQFLGSSGPAQHPQQPALSTPAPQLAVLSLWLWEIASGLCCPAPPAPAPETLPRAEAGGRMLAGPVIIGSTACYCSLCPGADKPP